MPHDEWEVLLREKLLIEHEMPLRMLGRETHAREAALDEETQEHSIYGVRVFNRPE